jgi:hypothetical protein
MKFYIDEEEMDKTFTKILKVGLPLVALLSGVAIFHKDNDLKAELDQDKSNKCGVKVDSAEIQQTQKIKTAMKDISKTATFEK